MICEGIELELFELGKGNPQYYFQNKELSESCKGGYNNNKMDTFKRRHELRLSSSAKGYRALLKTRKDLPRDDADIVDGMQDHTKLFTKNREYFYTTQPYHVTVEKYKEYADWWRLRGFWVGISLTEAWYNPGVCPLIVVAKTPLTLIK